MTKLSWKSAKSFFNNKLRVSQLKTLNFSFKIFLLIFDSVWCKIWAIRQKYSTNAKLVGFFGQLWSFVFLDLRSEKEISTKIIKFKKLQRQKVNIKRKVKLRRLFVKKTQQQSCESLYYPKSGIRVLCISLSKVMHGSLYYGK